jgi:hypothetical protein
MKRLLLLLGLALWCLPLAAQQYISGSITTQGTGTDCATAGTCVVLINDPRQNTATITITGNSAGSTLQFEATADTNASNSANWVATNAYLLNSTTAATSTTGDKQVWSVNVAGVTALRVRCSAYVSGTVTVAIRSSPAVASLRSGGGGGSASFPSGSAGNDVILSATTVGASVPSTLHTSAYASLSATVAACPASPAPCLVVVDPSSTPYTISAPLTIGGTHQSVTLLVNGATLQCTDTTGGRDCIDLAQRGAIIGESSSGDSQTGCTITDASTANITSLVTSATHDGTTSNILIRGCNLLPTQASTISQATLWLVAVDGYGNVEDSAISCTNPGGSAAVGVMIQDGPTSGGTSGLTFKGVNVVAGGAVNCVPMEILGNTGTIHTAGFTFIGGSVADGQPTGTPCAGSQTCLLDVDFSQNATPAGYGITFISTYFEYQVAGGAYIALDDVRGFECVGCSFGGGGSAKTNVVYMTHSASNLLGQVHIDGVIENPGSLCTNAIQNTVSSETLTCSSTSGDVFYTYPGEKSLAGYGSFFDGPLTASSGITALGDGTHAGLDALVGNTTVPASLPSNSAGFIGPNSASFTSWFGQLPSTAPANASPFLSCGTPSSNVSTCSFVSPATFATVTVTLDTSTPVTVSATNLATYHMNQTTGSSGAAAITYNLPTAAAGIQKCFTNSYNGTQADTGIITIQTSGPGQYIIFTDGTPSASGGYVTSPGLAHDSACVVGINNTQWQLYVQSGSPWVKH